MPDRSCCATSRSIRAFSTGGRRRPAASSGGASGLPAATAWSGGTDDETYLLVLHPSEHQRHLDRPGQSQLATQLVGIQHHPTLLDRHATDAAFTQPLS